MCYSSLFSLWDTIYNIYIYILYKCVLIRFGRHRLSNNSRVLFFIQLLFIYFRYGFEYLNYVKPGNTYVYRMETTTINWAQTQKGTHNNPNKLWVKIIVVFLHSYACMLSFSLLLLCVVLWLSVRSNYSVCFFYNFFIFCVLV